MMLASSKAVCRVSLAPATYSRYTVGRAFASSPSQARLRKFSVVRAAISSQQQHGGWGSSCRGFAMMPAGRRARQPRWQGVALAGKGGFMRSMEELEPEAEKLDYSLPLAVEMYPSEKLRAKNLRIGTFDEELETLAAEMFKIMYQTDGVGLAAPQVGVSVKLMVYNPEGAPNLGKEYVLVNPKINKRSKETDLFDEGCLSFPKICAEVERPVSCKVDYQDLKGRKLSMKLRGWQARIFQHEFDHLEGVLFHDRMTEDVRKEDFVQRFLDEMVEEHKQKFGNTGAP